MREHPGVLFRVAALAVAAVLLAPMLLLRAVRLASDTVAAVQAIRETDLEDRRLAFYGDCHDRGYGYLRDVVADIPDASLMPVEHRADMNRRADVVYPGPRRRHDDRIVVGLGHEAAPPFDRPGYVIVHRREACFTAVRLDLIAEIEQRGGAWRAWLDGLRAGRQ